MYSFLQKYNIVYVMFKINCILNKLIINQVKFAGMEEVISSENPFIQWKSICMLLCARMYML